VSNNFISIKNGAGKMERSDRRCKRKDCIFPSPTVRFDFDGHRVVALWSWTGVGVLDAPNGVKIKVVPTLRLVPISYN
jgi:hypothetical protein